MGQIVTFYSYKGGTGRTMTLANLGYILAWKTQPLRKVLMIDWDLEAPGLHKFFQEDIDIHANFKATLGSLDESLGLINYLNAVRRAYEELRTSEELTARCAGTQAAKDAFEQVSSLVPLSRYILGVTERPSSLDEISSAPGLFLLKAGNQKSPEYVDLVRAFPWQGFYDRFGSFFTLWRERLAEEYEFVLIDSRTGLTDVGDICTRVMPEKIIAVFVPNEQNLEGIVQVLRGAAAHRVKSRDPRGLVIYPLASRIDSAYSSLRTTWWKGGKSRGRQVVGYEPRFEELFKSVYDLDECDLGTFFDGTQISHDGDYAFGEEIAARYGTSDIFTIGRKCANLAQYLVDGRVPWDKPGADSVESVSAGSDKPASAEEAAFALLARFRTYVLPAAVALLALVVGIFGSIWERSVFGTVDGKTNVINISGLTVAASALNIAGFRIGTAEIKLKDLKSGRTATLVDFTLDRGTITPNPLLVPAFDPEQSVVVVTSEGLGSAVLTASVRSEEGTFGSPAVVTDQAGQVTQGATGQADTLDLAYLWPIALTTAAVAGSLLAIAFHLFIVIGTELRYPSLLYIGLVCGIDLVLSAAGVASYMLLFAPILSDSVKYAPLTIATVAFVSPWAGLALVSRLLRRNSVPA